jgi:hypothetical protein
MAAEEGKETSLYLLLLLRIYESFCVGKELCGEAFLCLYKTLHEGAQLVEQLVALLGNGS